MEIAGLLTQPAVLLSAFVFFWGKVGAPDRPDRRYHAQSVPDFMNEPVFRLDASCRQGSTQVPDILER